jgi:cytochrome bd-type quinol oxidase subunit 2
MKTSGIVAKAVSRLFLILIFLAAIFLFKDDGSKLQHLYIVTKSKWMFLFPALLVCGFVFFFFRCTIKKYTETDMNWLLVINTLVLMVYCATLFMRVYELTMKN